MSASLLVIAKEPVAGRSKTRLCPPCTPAQAAALAQAALADTLDAAARAECRRKVLVLDGGPGNWLPPGFEVVAQAGGGLGDRLAAAFEREVGPALLVGMDTPQMTPRLLDDCLSELLRRETDAVLGPAPDGGYWAIGFRSPTPGAFRGVPMSSTATAASQRARLERLGLRCRALPQLRDVDDIDDAQAVAAEAPASRFAATLGALELRHPDVRG